ncbi:hypothetical protein D3C87_40860 [compost metagenome]
MKRILFIGLAVLSIVSCKKETFNRDHSNESSTKLKKSVTETKIIPDNVVWGVGSDHRVYRWNAATLTWTEPTPGAGLVDLSVGNDSNGAVWGLGADSRVYRRVEVGNYWAEPNSSMRLSQISALSLTEAWGVYQISATERKIYKTTNGGASWTVVSASGLPNYNGKLGLTTIKVMPDNRIAGLGRDWKIYTFNVNTNQWSILPNYSYGSNPEGTYRQLTGIMDGNTIWAIKYGAPEPDQHIYQYSFNQPFGDYWSEPNYNAQLTYFSASRHGHIWGLSSTNHIYKWNGSYWDEPSPTARLVKISSGY